MSRAVIRFGLVGRSGFIAPILNLCRTGNGLKISCPVGIELQSAIDSAHAIKFIRRGELPIGVDRSNTGLPKNVAVHAGYGEGGTFSGEGITIWNSIAGPTVVGCQDSQRVRSHFPGQPRTELRIADAAGKEQVNGSLEIVRVFQKEWSPFGEEYFETLIDRDLGLVGLYLAEVGIGGDVQHQVVV